VVRPQPQELVHTIELNQCLRILVAVVADQLPNDGPVLLLNLCRFRDYADQAGFGKLWWFRCSA
jgi:hypothetical protein